MLTVGTLAACGGGSGSAIVDDPFDFGSDVGEAASNGLPFAGPAVTDADLIDVPFTVPELRLRLADAPEDVSTAAGRTRVQLGADFVNAAGNDLVIEIDGTPVSFIDGRGDISSALGASVLTVGEDGNSTLMLLFQDTDTFSAARDVSAIPLALQSDPATLADRSGTARMFGDLLAYGAIYIDGTYDNIDAVVIGDAEVTIAFDDGLASGAFDLEMIDLPAATELDGAFADIPLAGNGLTGTIDWTCPGPATCSGSAPFGAVFGGPTGEEIIGVTSIDLDVALPGDSRTFRHFAVGGFIVGSGS